MTSPPDRPASLRLATRRRRRWTVVALVAIVPLALPHLLAPWLRGKAVTWLERELDADVTLDDLRIGYTGEVRIRGLALARAGRPVARISAATANLAVFQALGGRYDVEAQLDGFELFVEKEPDGTWNLDRLLRAQERDAASQDKRGRDVKNERPDLGLSIAATGGRVVLRAEAEQTEQTELVGLSVRVELLDLAQPLTISASTRVLGPEGEAGRLEAQAEFVVENERGPSVDALHGTARLRAIDTTLEALHPLIVQVLPHQHASGLLNADVQIRVREGLSVESSATISMGDLLFAGPLDEASSVRLGDVILDVRSRPGSEQRTLHFLELHAEDYLSLLYEGSASKDFPPTSIQGTCTFESEIEDLCEIVRGWVPLRRELVFGGRITGTIEVASQAVEPGHGLLSVDGSLRGLELVARRSDGSRVDLEGLDSFEVTVAGTASTDGTVWNVPTFLVDAGPLSAEGTLDLQHRNAWKLSDSSLTLDADLARLDTIAGRVLELDGLGVTGLLHLEASALGVAEETELHAQASVRDLAVRRAEGEAPFAIGALEATFDGLYREDLKRLVLRSLAIDTPSASLYGDGVFERPVDPADEERELRLSLDATLRPDALPATVLERLEDRTIAGDPLVGSLALTWNADATRLEGSWESAGLTLTKADGSTFEQVPVRIAHTLHLDAKGLMLDTLTYASSFGTASLTGRIGDDLDLALLLKGDLNRLLLDADIEQRRGPRETHGDLTASLHVTGAPEDAAFVGEAAITGFQLESAPEPPAIEPTIVTDSKIALTFDGRRTRVADREVLDVQRLEIESTFVDGVCHGTWSRGEAEGSQRFEGVEGSFQYIPERLGAVLDPLLPGRLSGREEETLTLRFDGSAADLDPVALVAGSSGRLSFGLGRYRALGLDATGELVLELADGRLSCHGALGANGGTLGLDGDLRTRATDDAPLGLGFTAKLTDVRANAELSQLLGRLHPALLAVGTWGDDSIGGLVQGELELSCPGGVELLGQLAGTDGFPLTALQGRGRFQLEDARLARAPFLKTLLAELGLESDRPLRVRPIEFAIEAGRIRYLRPWTWTIDGVETTFTGTVGLDRSLDLAWNVPLTERLLERYDFLAGLTGRSIAIPISGSVDQPRLDWSDALGDLARDVAATELQKRLGIGDRNASSGDDPSDLLRRADTLWSNGKKLEAAALYIRLREEFKVSLVYALNRDRIKDRGKYKE